MTIPNGRPYVSKARGKFQAFVRIYVGLYDDREAATKAAQQLIDTGIQPTRPPRKKHEMRKARKTAPIIVASPKPHKVTPKPPKPLQQPPARSIQPVSNGSDRWRTVYRERFAA